MLQVYKQLIHGLVGIRKIRLPGDVEFSMSFEEFVKDGVSRNIEPYKINVGIGILNIRVLNANGEVIFDAAKAEMDRALQSLKKAKDELRELSAGITKYLGDDYFRRAWESFGLAHGTNQHAIGHLYDVRDAIAKKFGSEDKAREVLNLKKDEWSEFGKIFNADSVQGGRHNGKHLTPVKPMTDEQRALVMQFAKTMLFAYGNYLGCV
jgi:hypothetical protein